MINTRWTIWHFHHAIRQRDQSLFSPWQDVTFNHSKISKSTTYIYAILESDTLCTLLIGASIFQLGSVVVFLIKVLSSLAPDMKIQKYCIQFGFWSLCFYFGSVVVFLIQVFGSLAPDMKIQKYCMHLGFRNIYCLIWLSFSLYAYLPIFSVKSTP